jgi:hypothetical protein
MFDPRYCDEWWLPWSFVFVLKASCVWCFGWNRPVLQRRFASSAADPSHWRCENSEISVCHRANSRITHWHQTSSDTFVECHWQLAARANANTGQAPSKYYLIIYLIHLNSLFTFWPSQRTLWDWKCCAVCSTIICGFVGEMQRNSSRGDEFSAHVDKVGLLPTIMMGLVIA